CNWLRNLALLDDIGNDAEYLSKKLVIDMHCLENTGDQRESVVVEKERSDHRAFCLIVADCLCGLLVIHFPDCAHAATCKFIFVCARFALDLAFFAALAFSCRIIPPFSAQNRMPIASAALSS